MVHTFMKLLNIKQVATQLNIRFKFLISAIKENFTKRETDQDKG